ncbi:MAG TPA: response regulator [Tepidisphaeraceae bacterium]|nr:response regulator [Tepidisphaeraceae bacterium]
MKLSTAGQSPRCSVLIVDDDQVTRNAMAALLQALGYQVCSVGSVIEGLAKLDGQDCAVLDLELPDGLGTHILHRIRNEGRPIRVAVCSGITDEPLLATARDLGAELILRKPIDVNALLRWLGKTA